MSFRQYIFAKTGVPLSSLLVFPPSQFPTADFPVDISLQSLLIWPAAYVCVAGSHVHKRGKKMGKKRGGKERERMRMGDKDVKRCKETERQ